MHDFFRYATPIVYLLITGIWLYILIFIIHKIKENQKRDKLLNLLLLIISIDAFRTIFEGIFFGIRYTSLSGFIPIKIYNYLAQPEYVFLPKVITLITGLLVLGIVLNYWLPNEQKQKKHIEKLIKSKNSELIKKNKELIKAKEKAEESDNLKTEFLKNMSHEIRTPMNGIQGFSKFLSEPNIDEQKRQYYAKIIQNSSDQLLHIIDDILEISSLGTKQIAVNVQSFNLNELLTELFAIHNLKAIDQGVHLFINKTVQEQLLMIRTDKVKLSRIINILISNALKFTPEGSVELGYEILDDTIRLYVKDTGIGIDKENQKDIFNRFVQEEKDLSKKYDGLGLGLAIAKENAELIRSEITVQSQKGIGSTFSLLIPYGS